MFDDRTGPLDDAIDAVAREMTTGAPGVDMRARVQSRIDAVAARKTRRGFVWMVPATIAMLLVFAIGISRQAHHPVAVTPNQTAPQTTAEKPSPATIEPRVEQTHADATAVRRMKAPLQREHSTSVVASLAPPPLRVDPLAVAPMGAVGSIALSEMNVSPIEVAPLSIDDRPK
jgi:hypothetical protein